MKPVLCLIIHKKSDVLWAPLKWKCTQEWDLLAVLRFVLEHVRKLPVCCILQCYLSDFGLVL